MMKKLLAAALLLVGTMAMAQTEKPLLDGPKPHRFLDKTNKSLIGLSAVAFIGDAISTERAQGLPHEFPDYSIGHYRAVKEINPVARLFVGSHAGVAAYFGGGFAAEVGGMYWLHKHGHHRMERLLPTVLNGVEAYWTFRNYQTVGQYNRVMKQNSRF